jgi:hypothetical protein
MEPVWMQCTSAASIPRGQRAPIALDEVAAAVAPRSRPLRATQGADRGANRGAAPGRLEAAPRSGQAGTRARARGAERPGRAACANGRKD